MGNRVHQLELKRRQTIFDDSRQKRLQDERSSLVYCMRGHKLCWEAFAHLVGLDDQAICRHAKEATIAPKFLLYETRPGELDTGKHGVYRHKVNGHSNYVQSTAALKYPQGRGSTEDRPIMILPNEMTRTEIYADYVESLEKLASVASNEGGSKVPDTPLAFSTFSRYWDRGRPTLKVAWKGSDFCDLCTSFRRDVKAFHESDERSWHSDLL